MSVPNRTSGDDNPKSRSSARIPPDLNRQKNLDSEVDTVNPTTPLMGHNNTSNKPSLATPETVEIDDDREVVTKSHPGVDNGFINEKTDTPNGRRDNSDTVPDSEGAERNPVQPHNSHPDNNIPNNTDKSSDESDGALRHRRTSVTFPHFPRESDYGGHNHHHDMEVGSGIITIDDIPDINVYQHKKTLAQGMMDLALFSANANQLRYVMDSFDRHPYYYPSMIFICFSLILQVAIGVLLIWNATYNVKDEKEVCRANKINNYTVIGIFLVTVVNVFVSAFGVADPATPQIMPAPQVVPAPVPVMPNST